MTRLWTVRSPLYVEETENCYFASTETGWTNDQLSLQWVDKVFNCSTKEKARHGRDPRLLILDGHGSHINLPFLEWCNTHNIQVIAYPPHSTHRLQPLDVSLFAPLATYYSQELDNWITYTQGLCRMNKKQFYGRFKVAFQKAFTQANIQSGFNKKGIYPLNPAKVLTLVSTQQPSQEGSRPNSGGSSSSNISLSDWKKINTVV